jgi:hypothetical protein
MLEDEHRSSMGEESLHHLWQMLCKYYVEKWKKYDEKIGKVRKKEEEIKKEREKNEKEIK